MVAHSDDLRAEVKDNELVKRIAEDYTRAALSEVDRALCAYAVKLTRNPSSTSSGDLEGLRRVGLGDEAIHDATQVIAYFNYINRIADGLGVDPEPEWHV